MASRKFGFAVRAFSNSSAARGKLVKAPTPVFGIEGRYAHAVYSAAVKEKQLDVVQKDLVSMKALLARDVPFASYIANPTINRQNKKKVIIDIMTKQKSCKLTVNLFAALAENGRLKKVNAVLGAFDHLMSAHRGEVMCSVTTAKALDSSNMKELNSALQSFLQKGETIQLQTKVDPSLIGGMIVNIGDRYVDMSMATKIKAYTNVIKEAV